MQDKQLYQQIMGLAEPWFVERVVLDVSRQRVDVWVNLRADATWSCPLHMFMDIKAYAVCYDGSLLPKPVELNVCLMTLARKIEIPRTDAFGSATYHRSISRNSRKSSRRIARPTPGQPSEGIIRRGEGGRT